MASVGRQNFDVEVLTLPAILSRPEQGKRNRAGLRIRHDNIGEGPRKSNVSALLSVDVCPAIQGRQYPEPVLRHHPQRAAGFHCLERPAQLEDLRISPMAVLAGIALFDNGNALKDAPVDRRTQQLQVFGMRPNQRHRRARSAGQTPSRPATARPISARESCRPRKQTAPGP